MSNGSGDKLTYQPLDRDDRGVGRIRALDKAADLAKQYNTGGFIASLLVPAYADRARDYVRPMLARGILTLGLAGVLAATMSLPVAVVRDHRQGPSSA